MKVVASAPGLGFAPPIAALAALLGLVAVPWGGLAPGTLVAARLSGVSFQRLGELSAVLSLPVFLICGFSAAAATVGARRALGRAAELALAASCLWIGIVAANGLAGTAVAGVLGSLVGLAGTLALIRVREGGLPRPTRPQLRALAPYGALVALLLLSRGLAAVARAMVASPAGAVLSAASWPAPWLLVASVAATALTGIGDRALRSAARRSAFRLLPVALTTLWFLAAGALMAASGMSAALAHAASRLGVGYVVAVPWLGGLGGFLTGSNTGANAMFAAAQAEAAAQLAYPVDWLLAFHNVSASLLTMASAPRVSLALSLVDREGPEPGLVRRLLITDAAVLALLSFLAAVATAGP
ncbi:MAG: L-lactate permease [Bacillota bacterium]|nr:MAG: L-lactate permease [Bacillota bacterium]